MDLSIKSYRFYEQPIPATVRWNLSLYEYMGREVDPENIDDMVCMFQFQEGESILVLGEVDSDAYESARIPHLFYSNWLQFDCGRKVYLYE